MDESSEDDLKPTPVQSLYARILAMGMYLGLGCLFITFAIYVFGVMDPRIPHDKLAELWRPEAGGVKTYLEETGTEPGWGWTSKLGYGDFLNFVGIALMAGITILCYAAIVPALLRRREWIYTIIVVIEVLVLAAAASGLVSAGH